MSKNQNTKEELYEVPEPIKYNFTPEEVDFMKKLGKPRFKSQWNAEHFPRDYEVNTMPSMTVPDQSLSITQIMQRYARGLPLEGVRVPIYDEENDMPDFRRMDLAEKEQFIKMYSEELSQIRLGSKNPKEHYDNIAQKQKTDENLEKSTNNP